MPSGLTEDAWPKSPLHITASIQTFFGGERELGLGITPNGAQELLLAGTGTIWMLRFEPQSTLDRLLARQAPYCCANSPVPIQTIFKR